MNNRIINKMVFMVVFVVFGFSGLAFANMNTYEGNVQGVKIDVRPEGQNIFSYDNVGVSLRSHDMRDTTSSYGVSPTWKNAKDEQAWIDVRSEGQNIFSDEDFSRSFNNHVMDSQFVHSKDMRDTTSSYGIAPTWSDPMNQQDWYDLNILGR